MTKRRGREGERGVYLPCVGARAVVNLAQFVLSLLGL